MKLIQVTCAIIRFDERILAVQRSESMSLPLKWEFPGGKIEPNESQEECIKREIREEISIEIDIVQRLNPTTHNYPTFSIDLIPFLANHTLGEIALKEHKRYLLLNKEELSQLDWADADLPIMQEILYL